MKSTIHQISRFRLSLTLLALGITAFNPAKTIAAASGTEGASFLEIPVGAAPVAMGSAYTALATDAYAPIWNPAGLAFLKGPEVTGEHLSYLESINYEHLGFVHPLGSSMGLGFSGQYLGSGSMTQTDNFGNANGSFSSRYMAGSAAWGARLGEDLGLGVTAKWINAAIDDLHANAFAADFGALWKMNEDLSLAATLTNVGTALKFIDQADSLPLATHLGAAWHPVEDLLTSAELVYSKTGLLSERVGIEWKPAPMFALRTGYRTDTIKQLSPMAGLTAGAGLTLWGQEFSYAWVPLGDLGNTQYFSMTLRFGKPEEGRKLLLNSHQSYKHEYSSVDERTMHRKSNADDPKKDVEYLQLMQLMDDQNTELTQHKTELTTEDLR